jgi:hypothetical protein
LLGCRGVAGCLDAGLPGAGCCGVLPGAARLRRRGGTSRCCRVLPGRVAGLPGCRDAGVPVGCRIGLSVGAPAGAVFRVLGG